MIKLKMVLFRLGILNRAADATGSGKSLIIVKAIEYLYDLMNRDELPKKRFYYFYQMRILLISLKPYK